MRAASFQSSGPCFIRCRSVIPWTNSRIKKYAPSGIAPKSVAAATFGWSMCAPAIASR